MMVSNVYVRQTKRSYTSGTRLVGTAILTVFWVVLSLFAFSCTGAEAAVPKPEEISGEYHYYAEDTEKDSIIPNDSGTRRLILQGNTLYMVGEEGSAPAAYNAQAGTARWTFRTEGGGTDIISLRFSKGADGKVHASGTYTYVSSKGKGSVYSVNATKTRSIGVASGGEKKKDKESEKKDAGQKDSNSQKNQNHNQDVESRKDAERTATPDESRDDTGDNGKDDDAYDRDNLPDSDAGKAAAAIATGLGGAALGGAAGAAAGAAAGGAGGAAGAGAGAAGSAGGYSSSGYGPDEGGYGPDEGGYGPDEGGYGPDEGGYGPDEGGYGPDEGGYGPDEGGYGPDEGGYDPDAGNGYDQADGDQDDSDDGDQDDSDDGDQDDSDDGDQDDSDDGDQDDSDDGDQDDSDDSDQDDSDDGDQDDSDDGDQDDSDDGDQDDSDDGDQDDSDDGDQDDSDDGDQGDSDDSEQGDYGDSDQGDYGDSDQDDSDGDVSTGGAGDGGDLGTADGEPSEPPSFVYTDPATGAQTLYEKDPDTGQWVNPQTGGVLDMDDLGRFNDQRVSDRKWLDTQMSNLVNRNTALDKDLKNDWQNMLDEEAAIEQQGRKDTLAIKTGTYGMTDQERTEYLTNRQNERINDMNKAHQKANNWDKAVKTAEVVQKAADVGVDTLSVVTAPVGGTLVADVYSGVKNVAGSTAEAVAEGKSVVGGITKGIAKGGADILQNHAGGKWTSKLATYAGSETLKEVTVAAIDGEDVFKAARKGLVNGTFKYSVNEIGDVMSGGAGQQNWNEMKQKYITINNVYSKGISQKSTNALNHMNFQKYFGKEQSRLLTQGAGQTLTKEVGATAYDVGVDGKSVTESVFGEKW